MSLHLRFCEEHFCKLSQQSMHAFFKNYSWEGSEAASPHPHPAPQLGGLPRMATPSAKLPRPQNSMSPGKADIGAGAQ